MDRSLQLKQNFTAIETAIEAACQSTNRPFCEVNLMAVTKYAADEDVRTLLDNTPIRHIGESRVQQALARWQRPDFAKYPVQKHFIGHLQKNKAAQAARFFDFIDSIDNLQIAQLLSEHAHKLNKTLRVMVQIKLTDRETQSGISLALAPTLVKELQKLPYLRPCGYMAIAPQTTNGNELRPIFKQIRLAFERDFATQQERYLSLGMSNDFEAAVAEGATLPRVGSKLFA